jgi:hypothetical protein
VSSGRRPPRANVANYRTAGSRGQFARRGGLPQSPQDSRMLTRCWSLQSLSTCQCHSDARLRPHRRPVGRQRSARRIVALEAHHTKQEIDMLGLLVRTTRKHGAPDALYFDNGSTYRSDTCALRAPASASHCCTPAGTTRRRAVTMRTWEIETARFNPVRQATVTPNFSLPWAWRQVLFDGCLSAES